MAVAAMVATLAGSVCAQPSAVDDGVEAPERHTDFPCFLASDAGCGQWYPLVELGMAWGESFGVVGWQWHYRLWAELGVLVAVPGEPDLHIGPVINFGGDFGRVTSGYSANTRVKVRYWLGGSPVNIDFGAGPSFAHYGFDAGTASGTQVGAISDLSFGVLGMANVYGATTFHVDVSNDGANEVRLLAGFRGTLLPWGYALAGIGQILR